MGEGDLGRSSNGSLNNGVSHLAGQVGTGDATVDSSHSASNTVTVAGVSDLSSSGGGSIGVGGDRLGVGGGRGLGIGGGDGLAIGGIGIGIVSLGGAGGVDGVGHVVAGTA